MNKISIIIKREYLTRVRKKSFIIMTILAPLLMASMVILLPILMVTGDQDFKKIAVIVDGSDQFKESLKGVIPDTKDADFEFLPEANINDMVRNFDTAGYYGVLYISPEILTDPMMYSKKQPAQMLKEHISNALGKEIERQKLLNYNIENLDSILKEIRTRVNITTRLVDETGQSKETSTEISMILAYMGGFLMYMLVFIFGAQVMRGVIEEKTSRVVEVIVSSVKPVQLMMGKIIGIALVGLTQFMIWVILTAGAVVVVKNVVLKKTDIQEITQTLPQNIMSDNQLPDSVTVPAVAPPPGLDEVSRLFDNAMNQNWLLIITAFVFYFITGYLLYASIFAAIGSAVDNETETQQFMLPVTIPIILGFVVAIGTMQNPESSLSFWFSMIPLTSPIVMMARIPFNIVPAWEIALSMALMVLTFIAFVWMAAKIYRTGILMYGKKSSWKELWKWLRYTE